MNKGFRVQNEIRVGLSQYWNSALLDTEILKMSLSREHLSTMERVLNQH